MQRTKSPELVPEDSEPIWFKGAQQVLSPNSMKLRIRGIIRGINDRLGDPRNGPYLLLGALMSFGAIWLRRSQQTHSSQSNQPSQPREVSDSFGYLALILFKLYQLYLQLLYVHCKKRTLTFFPLFCCSSLTNCNDYYCSCNSNYWDSTYNAISWYQLTFSILDYLTCTCLGMYFVIESKPFFFFFFLVEYNHPSQCH